MVFGPSKMLLLLASFSLIPLTFAATPKYVEVTTDSGENIAVRDDRKPSLYTQDFGDCLGSSLINVTRFDAAYYQDNMTVLFHLGGNTNVANESIMMYIGVFAYGEARFDLTFNPCNAQIYSVPIEANGIIPVSQSDVAGIPPIALSIPDFEGQAILRIFGNSTQTEIGCYSATITNGGSFSHPAAVGTVLGIFTLVAVVASIATAVYGDHIPTMRTHYAHSLSVLVVFAVFHHIYYTGALSMNWPSVAVAWWSNFAWSGGMIYSQSMQNSINQFLGSNKGNISMVGAASSGASADAIGGGYEISQIYKRAASEPYPPWTDSVEDIERLLESRNLESHIAKRAASSNSDVSAWYGKPVAPGLPIPGNYSGFAGTLSKEGIPASNAFMTGFLWFLVLVVVIGSAIVAFKWTIEGLSKKNLVKTGRLDIFRAHWVDYTIQAVTRIMFISFFMIMFLALFEFTFDGSGGVTAIAALVFIFFFGGMVYLVGKACYQRLRCGRYEKRPDRLHLERSLALGFIPWLGFGLGSHRSEKSSQRPSILSLPIWTVHCVNEDTQIGSVHQDEDYVKSRGWLAARFRRTRWWFFAVWLVYEFIRACFYGGAVGHPMTQVFGLLVVECLALIGIVAMRPFEGARLNAILVYLLGFSKVATVALSAAFDSRFNLARITTTVIGIVIIAIQGVLTIVLMIAIIVGAISSYMSLTRNHENFKPRGWAQYRERYFAHLEKAAADRPTPPPPVPEEPKVPYFSVKSVRRQSKIEDEDKEYAGNKLDLQSSRASIAPPATARQSRGHSIGQLDGASQTHLPFGARGVHRASWSSRDFNSFGAVDVARNSQRMGAAQGIHQATPSGSRLGSVYGGLAHHPSDSNLRRSVQQPSAHKPLQNSGALIVRNAPSGTDGEKGKQPDPGDIDEQNSEDQDSVHEASQP
ncbi:MAG: hypothetical protein Q9163_006279 [Psora crenata]